jgi:hypothetical protein
MLFLLTRCLYRIFRWEKRCPLKRLTNCSIVLGTAVPLLLTRTPHRTSCLHFQKLGNLSRVHSPLLMPYIRCPNSHEKKCNLYLWLHLQKTLEFLVKQPPQQGQCIRFSTQPLVHHIHHETKALCASQVLRMSAAATYRTKKDQSFHGELRYIRVMALP